MNYLKSGPQGEIVLPENLRTRHKIAQDTPLRVIETRNGILLVPLTDEPMSPALTKELNEWQSLGSISWDMFDYTDEAP